MLMIMMSLAILGQKEHKDHQEPLETPIGVNCLNLNQSLRYLNKGRLINVEVI